MSRFYIPGTSRPVAQQDAPPLDPEKVARVDAAREKKRLEKEKIAAYKAGRSVPGDLRMYDELIAQQDAKLGIVPAPTTPQAPQGNPSAFLQNMQMVKPDMPLFTRDGRAVPAPLQVMPVITTKEKAAKELEEKDKIYNALASQYYKSTATPNPEYLKALADDIYKKR